MNEPPKPQIVELAEHVRKEPPTPQVQTRAQNMWIFIGDHHPFHTPVSRLFNAQPSSCPSTRSVRLQLRNTANNTVFTSNYHLSRTLGSVCRRVILRLVNLRHYFDPSFPSRKYNEFESVITRTGPPIYIPRYYVTDLVCMIDGEFAHFTTQFLLFYQHGLELERTYFCISQREIVRIRSITTLMGVLQPFRLLLHDILIPQPAFLGFFVPECKRPLNK